MTPPPDRSRMLPPQTPCATPQAMSPAAPQAMPSQTPQTPCATPQAMPPVAPQAMPSQTPQMPCATPQALPPVMPQATPSAMAQPATTAPDIAPATGQDPHIPASSRPAAGAAGPSAPGPARGGRHASDAEAGMMRAVQVTGPGRIAVLHLPLPQPGPGELRVRIEGCGVCASNLEPWAGPDWMRFPTEPGGLGHEAWGRVDALGAGVTGLKPGQRVALMGQHGFATHECLPAHLVLHLPPELADRPFPVEPVGCAMNVFRRSGISAGDRVAIIGIGFMGALLTRLAAEAGAEVIAISRRASSRALAEEWGAAHVVAMDDHDRIIDRVRDLTNGRFCDVVIEAVGLQWPLDLAGEIVAEGGRLVIAGYHQDGPRMVNMQNWNWRGIDVVNAHERDPERCLQGMRDAIAAVAAGRLDPWRLIGATYPLDRLDAALDATRDKPGDFVKAVVLCD